MDSTVKLQGCFLSGFCGSFWGFSQWVFWMQGTTRENLLKLQQSIIFLSDSPGVFYQLVFSLLLSLFLHSSICPFMKFPSLSYYPCILTPCPCICFYSPSVLLNRLQSKLLYNFHILLLKLIATSLLVLHLLSQPALFDIVLPVYETDRGTAASAKSSLIKVTVGSCKSKLRINFKLKFLFVFFSL